MWGVPMCTIGERQRCLRISVASLAGPHGVECADLRGMFAQVSLRFLRIQAIRDPCQVDDAQSASGPTPAFSEDLFARVVIQGQFLARVAIDQQKWFLPGR